MVVLEKAREERAEFFVGKILERDVVELEKMYLCKRKCEQYGVCKII
jgi:hypothetical protein